MWCRARREMCVAGIIPGSVTLVQSIRTVQAICRMIPKKTSIARVFLFQRDAEAIAILKKVTGKFIIKAVSRIALGWWPMKHRLRWPHMRITLTPPNFLIGFSSSFSSRCSTIVTDYSRKSWLISLRGLRSSFLCIFLV